MEVAKMQADPTAGLDWFVTPSSTSTRAISGYGRSVADQSSTAPKHWLPRVLGVAVAGLCVGVVAVRNETQTGTSEVHVVSESDTDTPYRPLVPLYLRAIEGSLQLTRSQLADALQIERATLYQWLGGARQPRPRNLQRIEALRNIASEWSAANLGPARTAWYMREPVSGHTLSDLLTQEELDMAAIRQLMVRMRDAPQSLEFVEPEGVYGFEAETPLQKKRRRTKFFAPTYSDSD